MVLNLPIIVLNVLYDSESFGVNVVKALPAKRAIVGLNGSFHSIKLVSCDLCVYARFRCIGRSY